MNEAEPAVLENNKPGNEGTNTGTDSGELTNGQKIPATALLLGLAGLIPFFFSAIALWVRDSIDHFEATFALIAYAAVILSFLGGVNWGAAIVHGNTLDNSARLPARLCWSIVPSLVAWAALLLQSLLNDGLALFILLVAFVLQYIADRRAVSQGSFPRWFGRLRLILTCGAVLSLTVGFAGALTT